MFSCGTLLNTSPPTWMTPSDWPRAVTCTTCIIHTPPVIFPYFSYHPCNFHTAQKTKQNGGRLFWWDLRVLIPLCFHFTEGELTHSRYNLSFFLQPICWVLPTVSWVTLKIASKVGSVAYRHQSYAESGVKHTLKWSYSAMKHFKDSF